jgi:hypothetical protein
VISRISLVKMRPRLASVAAFLCLIVAHFEWPDIAVLLAACAFCVAIAAARTNLAGRESQLDAIPVAFAGLV